jgi:hypothetical protein
MNATTRLRGRTPKRVRSSDELADLSRVFGADWQAGDNVMTWIRRHEGTTRELSKLVKDGWSWADLGRALARAGITYRSGKPIASDILRNKAWKARLEARDEVPGEPSEPAVARPTSGSDVADRSSAAGLDQAVRAPLLNDAFEQTNEQEPEFQFQPVTLLNWSGRTIRPKMDEAPVDAETALKSPQEGDVNAVIARLMGRK